MKWNTIRNRLALATGAATMLGLLAMYPPANAAKPVKLDVPSVPAAIQVPPGNKLFLVAEAAGTQNYTCTGGGTWGPSVPSANLFKNGHLIGAHFAGPTWQYHDGSSVLGTKIAGVTVAPDAIPWLLLKTVSTTPGPNGGDKMLQTTYIQRLYTAGGLAPANPCDPMTTANVPYTAVYYFYRAMGPEDSEDGD